MYHKLNNKNIFGSLYIGGDLSYISQTGMTLNLEERLQLHLALQTLNQRENFEEIKLWGKILGIVKDYFIAVTYNYRDHIEFPHQRMFWCSSG